MLQSKKSMNKKEAHAVKKPHKKGVDMKRAKYLVLTPPRGKVETLILFNTRKMRYVNDEQQQQGWYTPGHTPANTVGLDLESMKASTR